MSTERFASRLAAVGAAALALRIGYVLVARRDTPVWGDAYSYHVGANLLADGHGFVDPLRFELADVAVHSAYHPPLYTVYLAAWSAVGLDGPLAHRLASCLLGAATVVVVGLLARALAGDRAGLAGAGLAAVYPHLWLNDGALLSESAGALAIALALLTIERFRASPSAWRAAGLGATIALAALGRAEVLLLGPLVALPLVLVAPGLDRRARLARLGAGGAAAALVLGPWVGYNLARFEEPTLLSTGLGPTLAGGACDEAFHGEKLGYWAECGIEQVTIPEPDPAVVRRWRADPEGTRAERIAYLAPFFAGEADESERDLAAREHATGYIRDNAGRFPVVVAARVGRVWNVFRPWQNARFDGEIEGRGLQPARVALGAYFVLTPAAIAGLLVLRRRGHPVWPYVVVAGIVTLSAATTFGIQRYRIPFDVAVPALAAAALDGWWVRRTTVARAGAPRVPDRHD